jgi:hypothetical protein
MPAAPVASRTPARGGNFANDLGANGEHEDASAVALAGAVFFAGFFATSFADRPVMAASQIRAAIGPN